jgi:FtsP/CotA-like multicopper oxidase with cupredoxin domain
MNRFIASLFASVLLVLAASPSWAQTVCPRPAPGSVVQPPPDIYSKNGALNVQFNYNTTVDADGRSLFCFQTPSGLEGPTLNLNPGDQLNISATNDVPEGTFVETVSNSSNQCGDLSMYTSSLNIHYHGTTTSPACHQDQVIHTVINSGETFQYNVAFPSYIPPGLYWYHTHIHGIAEPTVQGGSSGALVVEGIQNYDPWLAGMPYRVLLIRDQPLAAFPTGSPSSGVGSPGYTCSSSNPNVTPSWDLDINYVPLNFQAATCTYTPAVIEMRAGQQELWRVCNCGADTILDIQVVINGTPQPLKLVSLDGVPLGSQNGAQQGTPETVTDILLAPAARAEFVVTGPQPGQSMSLITLNIDTGPDGDVDPTRTIAVVQTNAPTPLPTIPAVTQSIPQSIAASQQLANQQPTVHRTLYFSEALTDPSNPSAPTNFFITVDGATPVLFDPNNPPAIITHQGAIEDWTIQNAAAENHEFHFHQLHFLVLSQSGYSVPQEIGQFLDMVQVPFCNSSNNPNCPVSPAFGSTPAIVYNPNAPYPSVTVRLDFRGVDIGDFVYHCHILGHEDGGMMAIIRVLPPQS